MTIVKRYFSTAAAGTGDGTSWANRAELFPSGAWSTIITGHNFTNDTLHCFIGPGNYTAPELVSASFTVAAPSKIFNRLGLFGCDNNGTLLQPVNPSWVSAQPPWDSSGMPIITADSGFSDGVSLQLYMLKIVRTSSNYLIKIGSTDLCTANWCILEVTGSGDLGSNAIINVTNSQANVANCCLAIPNASGYQGIIHTTNTWIRAFNCRLEGSPSATLGERYGFSSRRTSVDQTCTHCTVFNTPNEAIVLADATVSSSGTTLNVHNNVVIGSSMKLQLHSDVSSTDIPVGIFNNVVVGSSVNPAIDARGPRSVLFNNRLRNNISNASSDITAYQDVDLFNWTAAGNDADEFVFPAIHDYRIKNTSQYWGKNIGAGDEPAAGGGASLHPLYATGLG